MPKYDDALIAALPDDPGMIAWARASLCSNSCACVEVTRLRRGDIGVRNSRFPNVPVVWFTRDEWAAFLDGVKAGEFDHFASPLPQDSMSGRALHRN